MVATLWALELLLWLQSCHTIYIVGYCFCEIEVYSANAELWWVLIFDDAIIKANVWFLATNVRHLYHFWLFTNFDNIESGECWKTKICKYKFDHA